MRNTGSAKPAKVVVLVGAKGSGKTTIGRMLESEFGAYFLHVESIAKGRASGLRRRH